MLQPTNQREPPQPQQNSSVWPPPPKTPQRVVVPAHTLIYLTGRNWLDAVLGVPAGFFVGFVLFIMIGILLDSISKPPYHRPHMLAVLLIGLVLTSIFYYWVQRKYSLLAFTMWFGGIAFYGLMFLLAWLFT